MKTASESDGLEFKSFPSFLLCSLRQVVSCFSTLVFSTAGCPSEGHCGKFNEIKTESTGGGGGPSKVEVG